MEEALEGVFKAKGPVLLAAKTPRTTFKMVKLAFCNLLLLLLSISFCASAQHQLGAEQTKRFSIAYQVNDLLGTKEVDVAEQVIDSLCLAHANDQELVGVIRVSMMDWLRYGLG
ncbi:hypothetical protein GCM10027594_06950 [Hymenobacter agri]